MTSEREPRLDDLVDGDLSPGERRRLERVHELLLQAGPPPTFSVSPPVVAFRSRRRLLGAAALAAAVGLALFAAGLVIGGRGDERGTFGVVEMTGSSYTTGLRATLTIFDADEAGNWPMELEVEGLDPLPDRRPYELWLTKLGKLQALCGNFLAEADGTTVVPLNAPYRLDEFDGWVVVVQGSDSPLLTT